MNISLRLLAIRSLAVMFLIAGVAGGSAQVNPAAPPTQPTAPPSKLVPTGLSANGGSMANGVYTNSIYRFSLQVPPGWAVVPTAAGQGTGNAQPPAVGHQSNRVLLIMTENAPFKKSIERKSLQIIATRLAEPPGPTAAEGFLTYSERTAKEKGLPVKYERTPERVTIHDQSFSKATLTQTTDGSDQHVEQYVTTEGENLLQFILISPTTEGLKDLQPTIQSLQFKADEPAKATKHAKKK